ARTVQRDRFAGHDDVTVNADAEGDLLEAIVALTGEAAKLLAEVAARFRLSARAYHRVLRVARTIADLEGSDPVDKRHVAEAAGYRLAM
ncbi:MAG TPA: ATP-binding protein, partial [Amaricoccus sp.]|nr:ATP-binding protein [Amaricoccus sp.]